MLSIPFFLFGCITLAVIVGWRFEGLAAELCGWDAQPGHWFNAAHDGCPVHHNGGFTP